MTAISPPRDAHAPWPPTIPRMYREAHQRFVAESRAFAWRQPVPAYANTRAENCAPRFRGDMWIRPLLATLASTPGLALH